MIKGIDVSKQAEKHIGDKYVYGCKGEVLTLDKYNELKKMYGNMVWNSDKNKIGYVCNDCSGLCSLVVKELGGKYYGYGSTMFKDNAKEVKPISDINNAPIGAFLWMQGHIGIYVGNGQYIAEDGSARNCCKRPLKDNKWTHYLLMDYIDYTNIIDLASAVSRIIKSGISIDYNSWKRTDLIKLSNVPSLLIKITKSKTYEDAISTLVKNNIISDRDLWENKKYNSNHVEALIIKFAKAL